MAALLQVVFSSDGALLFSSGADGAIKAWATADMEVWALFGRERARRATLHLTTTPSQPQPLVPNPKLHLLTGAADAAWPRVAGALRRGLQ